MTQSTPPQMTKPAPYDADALFMKSRLFINRALDGDRDFEESAFWACGALELLGKCALSRVNPLLIANPIDDGKSLLAASGVCDLRDFFSVSAKAVWSRCARAFRPFNADEATALSRGRNEYIHSGAVGFEGVSQDAWWSRFWAQAEILLGHCDQTVADYVGDDREALVDEFLAEHKKRRAARVEALLETARTRKKLHELRQLTAARSAEWAGFTTTLGRFNAGAECPACGAEGVLAGEEILERDVMTYDFEDREPDVTLIVGADSFSCPECHLTLNETELIETAGLEPSFSAVGTIDDAIDMFELEYENE